jgi:hypothetical protein
MVVMAMAMRVGFSAQRVCRFDCFLVDSDDQISG